MKHIGAGLDEDAFVADAQRGEIGHIGLLESAAMVLHALGLQVDELLGTAGAAVNIIPRLLAAAPGFHTACDLSLPYVWAPARMPASAIRTRTTLERTHGPV